jgi:hypothetical protein
MMAIGVRQAAAAHVRAGHAAGPASASHAAESPSAAHAAHPSHAANAAAPTAPFGAGRTGHAQSKRRRRADSQQTASNQTGFHDELLPNIDEDRIGAPSGAIVKKRFLS